MPDAAVADLTIAEAAALIAARQLTPFELTTSALERIGLLNPKLNAFITVEAERALEDARQATAEIECGQYRGGLHGIPIALKDLIDVAGVPTTVGSAVYRERVPETDATVVRNLRAAGAVLLGKTYLDELAFGGPDNPHYSPARNPWDLDRVPGGSSGGSAVAVAAGLVAGALGTDTAGSIRLPASFCGVVGLKPTYGRVSMAGVMPLAPSFDHLGLLTRTVEDAALLLGALAGYDPFDATTVPMPVPDYAGGLTLDVRGLRAGVLRPYFFDLLDDEVRASVETALDVLSALGVEIHDDNEPLSIEQAGGLGPWIMAEAAHSNACVLAARPEDLGEDVRENLTQPPANGGTLIGGMRAMESLARELRRRLTEVDVLITPSTPIVAPPRGEQTVDIAGQQMDFRRVFVRCLSVFNATRLPAVSVPCGFDADGLPVGFQLVGKPFDEQTLLNVGHAYERTACWRRLPPGLN